MCSGQDHWDFTKPRILYLFSESGRFEGVLFLAPMPHSVPDPPHLFRQLAVQSTLEQNVISRENILTIFCRCWLLLQMHFNERYSNICWQNTCSGHSWESTPWPRNYYLSYPWTFSPSQRSGHSLHFINFLGKVFLSLCSWNLVPKFDPSPQCQFSLKSSPEDAFAVLFQALILWCLFRPW